MSTSYDGISDAELLDAADDDDMSFILMSCMKVKENSIGAKTMRWFFPLMLLTVHAVAILAQDSIVYVSCGQGVNSY